MSGKANSSPIVTLTPAPTLDRTYFVTNLHSGAVNRADDVREELACAVADFISPVAL